MGVSGAIIAGAAIGAGTSLYVADKQQDAAEDQYNFYNQQQSAAAYAEAESMVASAEAEARSITGQASAEAEAYRSQAQVERDNLYAAAEEAKTIAFDNIAKMQMEADESLRRLEGEQDTWEAKARAKAGASGVRQGEGSTALYLSSMEDENDRQYGWLDESYKSGVSVAKKSANTNYAATKRQGAAAWEAGEIRANATLQAAHHVAGATLQGGQYSAEALRKKGASFLSGGSTQKKRYAPAPARTRDEK